MARDFPMDDELLKVPVRPEVGLWLLQHVQEGSGPALGAGDELCLRFRSDREAERFRERWISP